MPTSQRVIKNTGYLYIKIGITMVVSLFSTRIILNALGAIDFGIFNLVGGAIAFLNFLNVAMEGSTQRFMSYYAGQHNIKTQKIIFNVSLVLHSMVALISLLVLIVIGQLFFEYVLNIPLDRVWAAKIVYYSMICSTVFSILSVPYQATITAHENFKYVSSIGIIESILRLAAAYAIVIVKSDKLVIYGILMASIPFLTLTILRIYCHKKYSECTISPTKYFKKSLMCEMSKFSGWQLFSTISSIFTMQGVNLLINLFGGVLANSAAGIANQISGQMLVFSNNLMNALKPPIVKSWGGKDAQKALFMACLGSKMSFTLFSIFAIPMLLECQYILKLWLKNVPEYSVIFIQLVIIRQMITQLMSPIETCIGATGEIKKFSIQSSIIWALSLPLSYILYRTNAPIYTVYLVLIGTAIFRLSNTLYFCKILCGLEINHYVRHTIFPCIYQASILLIILSLLQQLHINNWHKLFIIIIATLLIYPILTFFIGLNKPEKKILRDLIINIKTYIKKKCHLLSKSPKGS